MNTALTFLLLVSGAQALRRSSVKGHSAGAQLAALLCIDDRYLKAQGVPFDVLRGCVLVDADTCDLPVIIMTAEIRQTVHGLPLPTFGHRVKPGDDPEKHIDVSAVTHVAKGKGIPPKCSAQGRPPTTSSTPTSACPTTRPQRGCSNSWAH